MRAAYTFTTALFVAYAAATVRGQQPATQVNARGPIDAPVTVVEFCSYDSEACERMAVVLDTATAGYADRVRIVFRHVPANDSPEATVRYRAALAAGYQGQFWLMHDTLFANTSRGSRQESIGMAHQLGLDVERLLADLESDRARASAAADVEEAAAKGVTAVPAVFVNGRSVNVREAEDLRAAIAAELTRAKD
jgi:protein-disulfide isomerase